MIEALVSVIVPIYNAENFLENILIDISGQTYKKLEIILINDGSTDNSEAIIQKFAQNDNRIQVINISNGGPANARNTGIDVAQGEYIRFLDADNRIPKNSIEEMVKAYSYSKDIDLVIGNYITIPEKNLLTGENIKTGLVRHEEFLNIFVENIRSFYIGVPWNKLYKRNIIEQYHIRFDKNIMWCEDFLFNIEYYDKCSLFYMLYVENGIYNYYLRESSITHVIKKQDDKNMIKSIDLMRYNKAKAYCEKNEKGNIFELEWNCSNVYAELSELSKSNLNMSLAKRYKEFINILSDAKIYEYIYMKSLDTDIFMWKMLEYLVRRHRYKLTFIIFVIKGYMVTNMKKVTKVIKKKTKHYIPPNL